MNVIRFVSVVAVVHWGHIAIYSRMPISKLLHQLSYNPSNLRYLGSAADTQAIADVVRYHLSFYEVQTGEPALVKTAANIFREMCYNYRDSLTAGIIVAGWDHKLGGNKLRGITGSGAGGVQLV